MIAFITGSLNLGSQLYSQCLKDCMKLGNAKYEFAVDNSPAGLLVRKPLTSINAKFKIVDRIPQEAAVALVYVEDAEQDAHYEQSVYDTLDEGGDFTTEVYVRAMPRPSAQEGVRPPDAEPYGDYQRALSLIHKRIRPIPTRGPQVWRTIEIRPNGGRPWFDI